jgi:hypothetical protein
MSKMMRLVFASLILILGFVGCGRQIIRSEPLTGSPTLAPRPMLTPMITLTFPPGKSPSILATTLANQTQMVQRTKMDCDGNPERNFAIGDDNYSPNHSWRIISCLDPKTGFLFTKFIENNGSKYWIVPFYETFAIKIEDKSFREGLKDGQMIVMHWSGDGKFAYLYPYICCIDGPVLFNGVPALYQLDLNTGKLKDMLPFGGRIGFSPDDKYLAYRTIPAAVHLRNLETGDDISFQLRSKYVDLGVFSWSPDSKKLIFVAALKDWDTSMYDPTPVNKDGFSLLLLDLETMKVTTLIDNDLRMFVPGSYSYQDENVWIGNDKLYLMGREEGKTYIYDVAKRQLILVSAPTSTPTP